MDQSQLHARIRQAMDQFLLDENTSLEAKEVLLRYIQVRPHFTDPDPIIPMEEAEQRLELITQIQRYYDTYFNTTQRDNDGRFRFTTLQMSYLLLLPLENLRGFSRYPMGNFLPWVPLEGYISFMIRGRIAGDGSNNRRSSLGSDQPAPVISSVSRNKTEREKCLARDGGACLLTGAALPEVCHIVPFAINATHASLTHCRTQMPLMLPLLEDIYVSDLVCSGLGCTDKVWNMLSLHPTLHYWWGKCFFGLKCVGIIPSPNNDGKCTLQLQFHWMSRNGLNPRVYTTPDHNTIQQMLQTTAQQDGLIVESRKYCSRRLETGHVFSIIMPQEDAPNMKRMIDIQWANTKLAAISGAAGSWELLDHSSDEPDPDAISERVDSWLEDMLPSETSS